MLAAFRSPLVDTEAKVKPAARQPCRRFGNASHPRACRFVSGETGVLARQPEPSSALARVKVAIFGVASSCSMLILPQLVNQDRPPNRNLTCA